MKPVGWVTAMRVMPDTEIRSVVMSRLYYGKGFKLDHIDSVRRAREALCDCLSAYEDVVEGRRGKGASESRAELRTVRRRLELELWP